MIYACSVMVEHAQIVSGCSAAIMISTRSRLRVSYDLIDERMVITEEHEVAIKF